MKTAEETYIQYLCRNCKNKHTDLCCIVRKINNILCCENYVKDKKVEGYKDEKRLSIKIRRNLT